MTKKIIQAEMRILVCNICEGYTDDRGKGSYAYFRRLCADHQREFVYKDALCDLVVGIVIKSIPLGTMYWMKNSNTSKYKLMDSQWQAMSFLQYCSSTYSINYCYFRNLSQTERGQILDYELLVYICEGTDDKRRE